MRSVRVFGHKGVAVDELPEPEPCGDHVVVKVMASAISGTERRYYDGGQADPWAAERDNGGHEAAGVVWRTDGARRVKPGDRVALFAAYRHCGRCRPCLSGRWLFCEEDSPPAQVASYHAQYVLIREDFCLPLPDAVDFEAGALLGAPFGAALRALRRLRVGALDRLLVMGQGPLGLAATTVAKFLGASVLAVDTNAYRLALAGRCGADAAVDPADLAAALAQFAGGKGVDAALDCSGAQAGRLACIEGAGRGGRVGLIGIGEGLALEAAQMSQVFVKELELSGSWYANPAEALEVAALVGRGLDLSRIVTHRFPIADAAQAFATGFGGEAGKVVILPWGVHGDGA